MSTVSELVELYLADLIKRDMSPRTHRTYSYVLAPYVEAFGDRPIGEITLAEVDAWVQRRAKKVTPTTLRKDVVVVRNLHRWANDRDWRCNTLGTLQYGKLRKGMPRPVEDDVWRRVWLSDLEPLDRMWLGLGYFAGLRRLEMVTVRPDEVLVAQGEMSFERKGGFHANVEYAAMYGWIDETLPHLTGGVDWPSIFNEHARHRQALEANYIWPDSTGGDEADCNRLNKRCSALLDRVGVPQGALTPHRLRHSCATNLLRAGVDPVIIQRLLAHSSIDITQRYMQLSGELARSLHRMRGTP